MDLGPNVVRIMSATAWQLSINKLRLETTNEY